MDSESNTTSGLHNETLSQKYFIASHNIYNATSESPGPYPFVRDQFFLCQFVNLFDLPVSSLIRWKQWGRAD